MAASRQGGRRRAAAAAAAVVSAACAPASAACAAPAPKAHGGQEQEEGVGEERSPPWGRKKPTRDALVEVHHVVDLRLEVARGVVALAYEGAVGAAVVQGLIDVRDLEGAGVGGTGGVS